MASARQPPLHLPRSEALTMPIYRTAPADNLALRESLYRGDIYLLDATPASQRFVTRALDLLQQELGPESVRKAQFRLSDSEFFQRIGKLRRTLYLQPEFH